MLEIRALPTYRWYILRQRYLSLSSRYYHGKRIVTLPTSTALIHFDDFYGSVYGKRWPSIRLALLCSPKKCALINFFSDSEETKNKLLSLGAVDIRTWFTDPDLPTQAHQHKQESMEANVKQFQDEDVAEQAPDDRYILEAFVPVSKIKFEENIISDSDYYRFYKSKETDADVFENETKLVYPSQWSVLSFPRGDISDFPNPGRDVMDLCSFKTIDVASLLPVIALNIQAGDKVADLCAAPGDMALAILSTLYPASVLLNDASKTKLSLLETNIKNFIPEFFQEKVDLQISRNDVRELTYFKEFDKILLDVPSMYDRKAVNEDEDNFFEGRMIQKRNELPHYLSNMLVSALKALKPGGTLVYVSNTLSPILNDGVVQNAINSVNDETDVKYVVRLMKDVFKPLSNHIEMDFSFRFGILVLPNIFRNYGPLYVSKICRKAEQ